MSLPQFDSIASIAGISSSAFPLQITVGNHDKRCLIISTSGLNANLVLGNILIDGIMPPSVYQFGCTLPSPFMESVSFLILNPTVGLHSITFTGFPAFSSIIVTVSSWYNVSQTSPYQFSLPGDEALYPVGSESSSPTLMTSSTTSSQIMVGVGFASVLGTPGQYITGVSGSSGNVVESINTLDVSLSSISLGVALYDVTQADSDLTWTVPVPVTGIFYLFRLNSADIDQVTVPIVTSDTVSCVIGTGFSYQIQATENPTTYSAEVLPPGLSLETDTGVISGVPTATGTNNVIISATNSAGTGSSTLKINIILPLTPPWSGIIMPAKNVVLSQRNLDLTLGGGSYTISGGNISVPYLSNVYVRLYTVSPTPSSSGTEMSGSNYSAVGIVNNATNWPVSTNDGTNGLKSNGTAITFPEASGIWAITAVAITDSSSNILYFGPLVVNFQTGQTPEFTIGSLVVMES